MAKAILTTKVDPTYDDLPEQRYHFPRTYLRQVEAARGDWIVYYEPRRPSGDLMKTGGKQAYFATARIVDIIADLSKADHFYALIEDFLPFDHAVPFKEADDYYENGLRKKDGSTNKGAFGRAVRNIPDDEYDLILAAGFAHVLGRRDRERPAPDPADEARLGFSDNPQMSESDHCRETCLHHRLRKEMSMACSRTSLGETGDADSGRGILLKTMGRKLAGKPVVFDWLANSLKAEIVAATWRSSHREVAMKQTSYNFKY